jgi:hypothetical protein
MSASSPLEEWRFLIGTWKGKTEGNQFGVKGVIEGVVTFSCEPSESFIMGIGENRCEGRLIHKSISILFYDDVEKKFRRKTFFSYGFIDNEVECARTKNEIKFEITHEPIQKQYEGACMRSSLRKISDTKIATGSEVAKEGKEFKRFGEEIFDKAK